MSSKLERQIAHRERVARRKGADNLTTVEKVQVVMGWAGLNLEEKTKESGERVYSFDKASLERLEAAEKVAKYLGLDEIEVLGSFSDEALKAILEKQS